MPTPEAPLAPWEGSTIHPDAIHDLADVVVVVECRYTGKYKPTDKPGLVWTLENGKVTRFHQYFDTARLQDVMRR